MIEEPMEPILPDESPIVKRPSPLAIQIIEKFLHEKKIRLLDLFASVDKDKDWKLTRDEFRLALQKVRNALPYCLYFFLYLNVYEVFSKWRSVLI